MEQNHFPWMKRAILVLVSLSSDIALDFHLSLKHGRWNQICLKLQQIGYIVTITVTVHSYH